jgi:hypothetical protein
MKRRWFQSIVVLGAIVALNLSAHAADTHKPRFSVKVKVSLSSDDSIMTSVSSYLNRELRSLGDVELVDNDPEWVIFVLALEIKREARRTNGVALSTVFIRSFNNKVLGPLVEPKFKDAVLDLTSNLSYYNNTNHSLNVGATEDLQEMCKEIIAKFDMKCLEESRKIFRQYNSTK